MPPDGSGGQPYDPDNDLGNAAEWEADRVAAIQRRRFEREQRPLTVLPPAELADALTEKFGLTAIGLKVTAADVYGRGREARVDVHLSDGSRPLRFDCFGDIGKPTVLATELMTQVGVVRSFKVPEALGVGVMVYQLARHHSEADQDEFAGEWGAEFLRVAPKQHFDAGDQADRWRAFSALATVFPARAAGEDKSAHALAQMSLVLVDHAGNRWVRAGWFQAYIKREVGGLYSPQTMATQMQRVGWTRPGGEGRVKATSPTDGQTHVWSFYVVPPGWESSR